MHGRYPRPPHGAHWQHRRGDHDELSFRDWLLAHPEDAKAYEVLKLSLWKTFEHDRDGYTAAKGDFVAEIIRKAKEQSEKRPET